MNRRAKITIIVLTVLLVMETIWLGNLLRQTWVAQVDERAAEARLRSRHTMKEWRLAAEWELRQQEGLCAAWLDAGKPEAGTGPCWTGVGTCNACTGVDDPWDVRLLDWYRHTELYQEGRSHRAR